MLDKRDTNGAIIQLKNALDKNPGSAEARLLLGQTLLQGGDPAAALIQLRKAKAAKAADTQVAPEIARALLALDQGKKLVAEFAEMTLADAGARADLKSSLAAAYAAQDMFTPARAAATAALEARPDYPAALVVVARIDATEGDILGALRRLEVVLARDGGNEQAGRLKGEILLARNDPDAAIAAYRRVLAVSPESVAARTAVIDILIQQSRSADARAELEQLKKVAPRNPETLFLRAQFAFDDQNYPASREITERLLVGMPDNLRVLVLACAAEYRMQHTLLAEGLQSRAVKNAPSALVPQQMLAQHYLRAGLPDKAVDVLRPQIESLKPDTTSLLIAGQAYLQAGDGKRAEAVLQRALKSAPADARARTALAMAQAQRGDPGPAIAELEAVARDDIGTQSDLALIDARMRIADFPGALRAVDGLERKLPEQALPHALRGRVLARQGDIAGAAASLEKALEKDKGYFPAITDLAAIDLAAGRPERARKRFEDLIKADSADSRARVALAEIDARLGVADTTVTAQLREAVRVDPTRPAPRLSLIDHLLASGNGREALVAAQAAAAALPNDLGISDALGQAQLASGDGAGARSTFKTLASLQPESPLPLIRLAAAFLAAKDIPAAERALRQALVIRPDDLMAQRGLALLLTMDQRPEEGSAIARAIQQRQPGEAFGFALEGELEAGRKHWAAAAAAYRAALQRGSSSDFAIMLHRSLVANGKKAEAESMAARWQSDNPADAVFIHHLGDLASAGKDWPRAEVLYRAVLALQPRNAEAMNNIAWLLATQHKPGATAMAERALALQPNRASLLDTLALAQESENQLPQAIQTQKRAAELDARSPMLRLRLAQLLVKQGDRSAARKELEALAKLGNAFSGQPQVTAMLNGL